MKRKKIALERDATISSSILALATSILGNTNIALTIWWHYLVAIIVMLVLFVFFFIATEIIINTWKKYFQRANISVDARNEFVELERLIKDLYEKHYSYQNTQMAEYKDVLLQEISVLNGKAINKLNFIDRFSSSKTLKNKLIIADVALLESYKRFCNTIKEIYDL